MKKPAKALNYFLAGERVHTLLRSFATGIGMKTMEKVWEGRMKTKKPPSRRRKKAMVGNSHKGQGRFV